jgi:hypothetical protein
VIPAILGCGREDTAAPGELLHYSFYGFFIQKSIAKLHTIKNNRSLDDLPELPRSIAVDPAQIENRR